MTETWLRINWYSSENDWEIIKCQSIRLDSQLNVSQKGTFSVKIIKFDWVFSQNQSFPSQNGTFSTQNDSKMTEILWLFPLFFKKIKIFQNYPPFWAYIPISYFCYFRRQSKKLKVKNSIPERLIQTTKKRAFDPNKLLFWQ